MAESVTFSHVTYASAILLLRPLKVDLELLWISAANRCSILAIFFMVQK